VSKSNEKQVVILDDHQVFAEGLAMLLSNINHTFSVTFNSNPRFLLNDAKTLSDTDLLLVDIQMPTLNGFDFLKALKARNISTPTLIISATEKRSDIESGLKFGARGFVPKSAPSHEIVKAMNSVLNGQLYVPEHLVGAIDWGSALEQNSNDAGSEKASIKLSKRQLEVLSLIHDGHSNSQISTILNLSESTIKTHISLLFRTLKVKNRTACIKVAARLNLISLA